MGPTTSLVNDSSESPGQIGTLDPTSVSSGYGWGMRHRDGITQIRGSLLRSSLLAALLVPMACAVATEPALSDGEDGGSAGTAAGKAGSPPIISAAGTSNAFGGTGSMPMTGGAAGMTGSAGKGGTVASGGKPSGGGGQGGSSSAGANHGGSGGSSGSGGAAGGSGGAVSNGCSALKAWKGGDSTLTIAAGEVVSWKGKRYKATAAIAYPNTECAPDAPAMWCANWFTPDGDC